MTRWRWQATMQTDTGNAQSLPPPSRAPHPSHPHLTNIPVNVEAILFGTLSHKHTAGVAWQGQLHASLVRSSNVTSTFNILCLSLISGIRTACCCSACSTICPTAEPLFLPFFPRMLKRKHQLYTKSHFAASFKLVHYIKNETKCPNRRRIFT